MTWDARSWRQRAPLLLAAATLAASALLLIAPINTANNDVAEAALAAVPDFPLEVKSGLEADAAAVIARPLFVQGRRALLSEEGGNKALGDLRLAGTIATVTIRKALFRDVSGGDSKGVWVAAGGEIAGWRVVLIEPGRVALQRGGEQISLSISKHKALTPKQASQARAATPIRPSDVPVRAQMELESRQEKLNEALSKLGEDGFYGTPE